METVKKKRIVVNSATFQFDINVHGKKRKQVSLTQPDEAISIKELVERHTRGMENTLQATQGWDTMSSFDSADLEKLSQADLVDRQEFIDELAKDMLVKEAQLKEKYKKDLEEAERKRLEFQEVTAEVKRQLAERKEREKVSVSPK